MAAVHPEQLWVPLQLASVMIDGAPVRLRGVHLVEEAGVLARAVVVGAADLVFEHRATLARTPIPDPIRSRFSTTEHDERE